MKSSSRALPSWAKVTNTALDPRAIAVVNAQALLANPLIIAVCGFVLVLV